MTSHLTVKVVLLTGNGQMIFLQLIIFTTYHVKHINEGLTILFYLLVSLTDVLSLTRIASVAFFSTD